MEKEEVNIRPRVSLSIKLSIYWTMDFCAWPAQKHFLKKCSSHKGIKPNMFWSFYVHHSFKCRILLLSEMHILYSTP